MNAKPHTHEVKIEDYGWGYWWITYGDQAERVYKTTYIPRRWFWQKPTPVEDARVRLGKAVKRLVERHDTRSRAAGREQELLASVIPSLKKTNQWGSEQLK